MGWNQVRMKGGFWGAGGDDSGLDKVQVVARERSRQTQATFPGDPTGLADGLVMKVRNPAGFLVSSSSHWEKLGAIYCHRKSWEVGSCFWKEKQRF